MKPPYPDRGHAPRRRTVIKALTLGALALAAPMAVFDIAHAAGADQIKVVYHLSDGLEQASRALANIRNHLRAAPDTRIVVVALGDGIRFLLEGAKDRNGKPYDAAIAALASQGVEFRVCNNTLAAHGIDPSKVVMEAKVVESGVAEVARLQAKEGFVYLRP
jgi:intracellular sulfur oxidation DsrE/DsrF family protein